MENQVDIMDGTPLYILYTKKPEYQSLREGDQKFFKKLFPLLLFSTSNEFSHKYLSEVCKESATPIPESTLQKRLRRLATAKLIHKWEEKELIDGKWITTHTYMELEKATFSFVRAKLLQERIDKARMEALENGVYLDRVVVDTMKNKYTEQANPAPPQTKTFAQMLEEIT
ncbi:MAG: hypothetical protein NC310_08335 [Roseburia sp.]|nr:hypothetical protein [Anaeroplasma bactoclasticum]MCM1197057.1 hypothetical protein [Roseburia sp.]